MKNANVYSEGIPKTVPENGQEHGPRTKSDSERIKALILSQNLPIRTRMAELESEVEAAILDGSGVFVLEGETGSGKSVYSPIAISNVLKRLGLKDKIVMMQPRRDAASGIARAVAAVTDKKLGQEIGYSTSEEKQLNPQTSLRVVTSGIFLRYLIVNRERMTNENVSAVIIDELHEGTVDYHLVLGVLKMMREEGNAPFIFLTSATLDKDKILEYFGIDHNNYLRIEGRSYPVTKEYVADSPSEEYYGSEHREYIAQTVKKIKSLVSNGFDGDMLVFLPGMEEIEKVSNGLDELPPEIEVLPLHGTLAIEDREKVIFGNTDPKKKRIILSTNIAETSLTVPGVKVVVDTLRQRAVRFNPDTGINERGTEYISIMQAEQRAGRAGRLSAGHAVRMVTEKKMKELKTHPDSEISRVNLADTMLKMIQLGLDPDTFPFIERPSNDRIAAGLNELSMLGAIDAKKNLTEIGRQMIEMPFEPRLSRMIIEARELGCLDAALVLIAFEREKNVWFGPSKADIEKAPGRTFKEQKINARNEIQGIQSVFAGEGSDLMRNLNLFAEAVRQGVFEASRRDGTPESAKALENLRNWARRYYVNYKALTHIAYRLGEYARYANVGDFFDSSLHHILSSTDPHLVGRVILSGYPDNLMFRAGFGAFSEYRRLNSDKDEQIMLSPGSVTFQDQPKICLASSFETGGGTFGGMKVERIYAKDVHPVSTEDLLLVMGNKIETRNRGYYTYDAKSRKLVGTYTIVYKGKLIGSESLSVGQVEGEKFADILADVLVEEALYNLPQVLLENQKLMNEIISDSGYRISRDVFRVWYKEKLAGLRDLAEIEDNPKKYRMKKEDFMNPSEMATEERFFPKKLSLNGHEYEVKQDENFYYFDDSGRQVRAFSTMPVVNITNEKFRKIPSSMRFNYESLGEERPIIFCVNVGNSFRYGTFTGLQAIFGNHDVTSKDNKSKTPEVKNPDEGEVVEKPTKVETIEEVRSEAQTRLSDIFEMLKYEKSQKSSDPRQNKDRILKTQIKLQALMSELSSLIKELNELSEISKIKSRVGDINTRAQRIIKENEIALGFDGKLLIRYEKYKADLEKMAIEADPNAKADIKRVMPQLIALARDEYATQELINKTLEDIMIESLV